MAMARFPARKASNSASEKLMGQYRVSDESRTTTSSRMRATLALGKNSMARFFSSFSTGRSPSQLTANSERMRICRILGLGAEGRFRRLINSTSSFSPFSVTIREKMDWKGRLWAVMAVPVSSSGSISSRRCRAA